MDLQTLLSFEKIKGILLMSQAGEEGGNAHAHVLTAQINPSGKLTDTWAKTYQDYPAAEHFGAQDGDLEKTVYEEGIYVGYRYFDRAGIEPQFSFGYGLSYTKFQLIPGIPSAGPDGMTLSVIVRNTGDLYSGKEVLQLLQDTCRREGMTVLIITHNSALMPMGDRVIRLRSGLVREAYVNPTPTPIERIEW
jgi:beta-glucosidase